MGWWLILRSRKLPNELHSIYNKINWCCFKVGVITFLKICEYYSLAFTSNTYYVAMYVVYVLLCILGCLEKSVSYPYFWSKKYKKKDCRRPIKFHCFLFHSVCALFLLMILVGWCPFFVVCHAMYFNFICYFLFLSVKL